MKTLAMLFFIGVWVFFGISCFKAAYEWSAQYQSSWELSVKASTISQKSEYMNKFVSALEASGLQGTNSSMYFQTPNTSFDENLRALKSLQERLEKIKTMKEDSFEYQTAIQQITAQEQGEAVDMIGTLHSCWYKTHHYWLWSGWFAVPVVLVPLFGFFGLIAVAVYS